MLTFIMYRNNQLKCRFLAFVIIALTPLLSHGFGTTNGVALEVKGWRYYKEHANITFAALSCQAKNPVKNCFEPGTMETLAGLGSKIYGFGAIGAADNYSYKGSGPTEWHCSEADYIPPFISGVSTGISDYPTSENYAKRVFERCRNFAKEEFLFGHIEGTRAASPGKWGGVLGSSRYYFTTNNSFDGPLTWYYAGAGLSGNLGYATLANCYFSFYNASGGKCHVLNALGRGLHAVEDFYAHSNWGDIADPKQPVSIDNPPGLGMTTLAPFWRDLDEPMPWIEGLSSGCYGKEWRDLPSGVKYSDCSKRVADLEWRNKKYVGYSKDVASFDPKDGVDAKVTCADYGDISSDQWAGCQPRGSIMLPNGVQVQQNVTTLAIMEVRRQWEWIQKKIYEHFGKERGDIVICYITKDEVKECSPT